MATVFVITLETILDPHGVAAATTEVRGVFASKAGANAAARSLLHDEEALSVYEQTADAHGNVAVYAECIEGDELRVAVREHVLRA